MTLAPPDKLLYSTAELMHSLGGISRATLDRLFQRGEFHRVKIGHGTYARVDEVAAYIERQTVYTDKDKAA